MPFPPSGPNCEINLDDCASNPCDYGKCIDKINSYECTCKPGYTGEAWLRPLQERWHINSASSGQRLVGLGIIFGLFADSTQPGRDGEDRTK